MLSLQNLNYSLLPTSISKNSNRKNNNKKQMVLASTKEATTTTTTTTDAIITMAPATPTEIASVCSTSAPVCTVHQSTIPSLSSIDNRDAPKNTLVYNMHSPINLNSHSHSNSHSNSNFHAHAHAHTHTHTQSQSYSRSHCSCSDNSSNCSPTTIPDSSFDSGIEGVIIANTHNSNNIIAITEQTKATTTTSTTTISSKISSMPLRNNLQKFQIILQALEHNREHFYMLRQRLSNISEKNRKKSITESYTCNTCCTEIKLNEPKSFVKCGTCQKLICRNIKCAYWLPKFAQWECELCQASKESLAKTSSWVANQLSLNEHKLAFPLRARSEIHIPITDFNEENTNFDSISQCGTNPTILVAKEKLRIRQYVEEIIAKLLLEGTFQSVTDNNNYILSSKKNSSSNNSNNKTNKKNNNNISNNEPDNNALYNSNNIIHHNNNNNNNNNKGDNGNDVCVIASRKTQTSDLTSISENRLRHIIQKVIAETMPSLMTTTTTTTTVVATTTTNYNHNHDVSDDISNRSRSNHYNPKQNNQYHYSEYFFKPKVHHELIATEVFNEIVNTQKQHKTVMSESTPDLRIAANCEIILDQNYNVEDQSTTSIPQTKSKSDCCYSEIDNGANINRQQMDFTVDQESEMNDYISAHTVTLPELSNLPTESDEDDLLSVTSSFKGEDNWENNWLFKKKHGSISGNTTGILIPDPKEDVRAQIGDKAVDEFSDLSELDSDTDDGSSSLNTINSHLLNKELIGGKNNKIILDNLIEQTNITTNTGELSEQLHHYTDTLNEHVIDAPVKNEAINCNINSQQTNYVPTVGPDISLVVDEEESKLSTGSIAEREHKKWFNAVEMPNNPYAPEALRRRISGDHEHYMDLPNIQSPMKDPHPLELLTSQNVLNDNDEEQNQRNKEYRRYSRDYYINNRHDFSSSTVLNDINVELPEQQHHHNCFLNNEKIPIGKEITEEQRQGNVTENVEVNLLKEANDNYSKLYNNNATMIQTHYKWTIATNNSRNNANTHMNRNSYTNSNININNTLPMRRCCSLNILNQTHQDDDQKSLLQYKNDNRLRKMEMTKYHNYILDNRSNMNRTRSQSRSRSRSRSCSNFSIDLNSHHNLPLNKRTIFLFNLYNNDVDKNKNINNHKRISDTINAKVLAQFEKQLLHKDLKRNSFRAISSTTKDFVLNPLYEIDSTIHTTSCSKCSSINCNVDHPHEYELETVDSGVDSYLNGFDGEKYLKKIVG